MRSPFSPIGILFLALLLSALFIAVQIGALKLAFDKLGLSSDSAITLLLAAFIGSLINVPLFKMKAEAFEPREIPPWLKGILRLQHREFKGYTQVFVNAGGCLLPLTVTFYLIQHSDVDLSTIAFATLLMSLISYGFSRPLHGIGIGMPIFVAPLAAALISLILEPGNSAPLAYISGTLGVLIGADLLRLKDISKMGTPVASIGGAGTFDGIFITGIVAALLA